MKKEGKREARRADLRAGASLPDDSAVGSRE